MKKLLYLFELDGRLAGRFSTFAGGGTHADVIVEKVGAGQVSHKHLGAVKFEEMILECGTGMTHAFYDRIGSAFSGGGHA